MTDLQLAREKQQGFEAWQKENGKSLSIDMSVQVLTTGFWPQYKVRPCRFVLWPFHPPPYVHIEGAHDWR